jgi:hypothetical protein
LHELASASADRAAVELDTDTLHATLEPDGGGRAASRARQRSKTYMWQPVALGPSSRQQQAHEQQHQQQQQQQRLKQHWCSWCMGRRCWN